MKTTLLLIAAAACALPAHAVLVSAAADLGTPRVTETFEAYDGLLTTGPLVLSPQVRFTGDTGSEIGAFVRDLGENGIWGVGNNFAASGFFGELRFTFAALSAGAGAFVNHFAQDGLPFALVVSAYGDNNQIIETHTVTVATGIDSYNAGVFAGISRAQGDIRSLSFKGVGVVVDDFTVSAVPEPAAAALLLAGGGFVVALAARRRRAQHRLATTAFDKRATPSGPAPRRPQRADPRTTEQHQPARRLRDQRNGVHR